MSMMGFTQGYVNIQVICHEMDHLEGLPLYISFENLKKIEIHEPHTHLNLAAAIEHYGPLIDEFQSIISKDTNKEWIKKKSPILADFEEAALKDYIRALRKDSKFT
jgi:hypothetical protein